MMLTGRRIAADEGQRLGLSHELVDAGAAEARARALAVQIAGNAPLTNQLILTALPRIGDMSRSDGLWAEALTTAVSQSTADADEGLRVPREAAAGLSQRVIEKRTWPAACRGGR